MRFKIYFEIPDKKTIRHIWGLRRGLNATRELVKPGLKTLKILMKCVKKLKKF